MYREGAIGKTAAATITTLLPAAR